MSNIKQKLVFQAASEMAKQKEDAISDAFDHYFRHSFWQEKDIKDLAYFNVDAHGEESFWIKNKRMINFGQIKSDTEIDYKSVICKFSMSVEVLYK